ncbi:MAG: hypothetical protein KJP14_12675 [Eudoraea sp.]|nr:hypothetical protein [Eudoraea sp.]MBT8223399.1 hypothetical protein [Eudoraea sp.]
MKEKLKKIPPLALYALSVVFLLFSRAYEAETLWLYYCCLGLGILFFFLAGISVFLRNNP